MPEDLLLKIRATARAMRDQKLQAEDLEQRLKEIKRNMQTVSRTELPELMANAGLTKLTIEPEGNIPSFEIQVKPYAHANIAQNWSPERRQEAFDWLDDNGHGDLIKTEIAVYLDRNDRQRALDLIELIRSNGFEPEIHQTTHWKQLTKWLRECIQRGIMVPLDIIGGEIGMEATIKED